MKRLLHCFLLAFPIMGALSCTPTAEKVLVSSIGLSERSISLYEGSAKKLTATVLPENAENKELEWISSNTSVAEVSSSGMVTAIAKGNVVITVKALDGSGVENSCQVTVLQAVSLSLNWTSAKLFPGEEVDLVLTVTPEGAPIEWTSSSSSIASVSSGHITAHVPGIATISAYVKDDPTFSARCNVTVLNTASTEVHVHTVYLGETLNLKALYFPSGSNIVWKSLDNSVAEVSADGVVTPQAIGETVVVGRKADASSTVFVKITVWKKQDGGGGDNEGIGEGDEI